MQAVLAWLLGTSLLAACGPSRPPRENHQASTMSPSPGEPATLQGLPAELRDVRDQRVTANMRRGSAALRLTVTLEVPAASEMTVQGQLFAGSTLIADVTHTIDVQAGVRTEPLDFPGDAIHASGLDGPYTVYLTIAGGPHVAHHEHTTAAYSATDFHAP